MSKPPAVMLRPVNPGDEELFARWGQDRELRRLYLGGAAAAADGSGAEPLTPVRPSCRSIVRAIEGRGAQLIGWVELRDISWRRGSAELRICIGRRDRWNLGYGTQAVRALIGLAFTTWRLTDIHLRVATWNARAIRAYEKCGFAPEGVLRAGRRREAGHDDLLLMTLDRRRWLRQTAEARRSEALQPRRAPAAPWWRPERRVLPAAGPLRPAASVRALGRLGSPV